MKNLSDQFNTFSNLTIALSDAKHCIESLQTQGKEREQMIKEYTKVIENRNDVIKTGNGVIAYTANNLQDQQIMEALADAYKQCGGTRLLQILQDAT